jgi:hypothetical protein
MNAVSTLTTTVAAQRNAYFETCAALLPKRYTSDPDVIDNPEELRKVQAEWDAYFQCVHEGLERYPLSAEESKLTLSEEAVKSTFRD